MAQCLTPFHKTDQQNIPLPCGNCPTCTARRASFWSFRLMQEYKQCKTAYFVTFTYENDSVPMTQTNFMTLQKTDMQDFMRRIRRKRKNTIGSPPFDNGSPRTAIECETKYKKADNLKYYVAGEYGEKNKRPHYHAIIFNLELEEIITKKEANFVKQNQQMLDGKTEFQSRQWPHGHITIGTVTEASVGYSLKYISKPKLIGRANWDLREKEFALMSKKIGKNYLTPGMVEYHKQGGAETLYCTLKDGKKIAMPRYYKGHIWTKEEQEEINYQTQLRISKGQNDLTVTQRIEKAKKENLLRIHKLNKQQKNYETEFNHNESLQPSIG